VIAKALLLEKGNKTRKNMKKAVSCARVQFYPVMFFFNELYRC
jgi:hypothetical protein